MIEIVRIAPANAALLDRVAPDVFDEPIRPDRLAAYLASPDNLLLVAVDDGLVVAQCAAVVHRHPDRATELYLDNLGTEPAWQRRGIARRLIEEMLALGRAAGCKEAWIGTEVDNAPARALYAQFVPGETVVFYTWELG